MSHLEIEYVQPRASVLLLRLTGELDAYTLGRLDNLLGEALAAHPQLLIVDISGLSFLSSAGLGLLLESKSRAQKMSVQLVLVQPSARVREVISCMGGRTCLISSPP
jgi:anti-sigma B factor antagonist